MKAPAETRRPEGLDRASEGMFIGLAGARRAGGLEPRARHRAVTGMHELGR